jgi:hypothetical protein
MNEEKPKNKALSFLSGEGILVVLVIISVISMFLNKKPMADTLADAVAEAYRLADGVTFENAYRRSDIGQRGLAAYK